MAAGEAGTLSIGDARMPEGDSGTGALSFPVTLSEANQGPVSVSYRTQNETALAGEDYDSTQGTLAFAPGETTKNVPVSIRGDLKVEHDEFFSVILSAPNGAAVADPGGVGTGTIENDDAPPPLPKCRCKRVQLRLAGLKDRTPLTGVVTATMTCGAGIVPDCVGFVRVLSPFATLRPTPFTCRSEKCSSTSRYTRRIRIAPRPVKRTLRLRVGCRGQRGELRTFTIAPSST